MKGWSPAEGDPLEGLWVHGTVSETRIIIKVLIYNELHIHHIFNSHNGRSRRQVSQILNLAMVSHLVKWQSQNMNADMIYLNASFQSNTLLLSNERLSNVVSQSYLKACDGQTENTIIAMTLHYKINYKFCSTRSNIRQVFKVWK